MIALRSQFPVELIALAVLLTSVAALIGAKRSSYRGGSGLSQAARVLAVGAVVVTIISTGFPLGLGIEEGGDLALGLGRGGLGDWKQLLRDPLSLASIELVGNVLLYAAIALPAVLGWFERKRYVLPACFALSVVVETSQYLVLGRVATLDDVILNMGGALVGYTIALALVLLGVLDRGKLTTSESRG